MQQQQDREAGCPMVTPLEQAKEQEGTSQEIVNRMETLLATAQQENRKREIRRRKLMILSLGQIGLYLLIQTGYVIGHALKFWGKMPEAWQAVIVGSMFLNIIFTTISWFVSVSHRKAVDALSELEDVRAIGPLVSSLEWMAHTNRSMVVDKLIQLLPRIQPADAGILNANQRAVLYRTLDKKYLLPDGVDDRLIDFQIAVLKALEQIEDGKALPYVEALANRMALSPREQEARTLAQSCLPVLRQRAEQMQAETELLRASNSPTSTSEELLRAARQISEVTPEQLLRGIAQEEES